ncbi:MAG: hypothetical protein QOJ79_2497 [Actinomycetota bacterium]|jgi:hypothetical protein|nr:hypothetical protein [Actinomycetota bacterium]
MHRWVNRRLPAPSDESGFGLILVVGFTMVLLIMLMVGATVSINSLRSSRTHATFEQALAVAEAGVDQTLAILQQDKTYNPCSCAIPASALATDAAERKWARDTLKALAVTRDAAGTLPKNSQGNYLAIRPTGAQKVYAMSWAPKYGGAGVKTRLIKVDYLFSPYKPGNALLTNGDVNFTGGSVTIKGIGDACPGSTTPAPVHSNGSVTGTANSSCISGAVTASGTYQMAGTSGAGSGGSAPLETVPTIDPLTVYTDDAVNSNVTYTSNWYDLCPAGIVKAKGSTPCTGSQLADTTVTTVTPGYRGWTYSKTGNLETWTMGAADSPYAGIYYVYQGDAYINGGTTGQNLAWNATVFAEPKVNGAPGNSTTCNKLGGNISWHNTDVTNFMSGMVLEAGSDLTVEASSNTLRLGLFAAGDQVYMSSSSATTVSGAVIAGDACQDASNPSKLQGLTIDFDSTFETPVKSVIRTTQWIEYVG